MLASPFHIQIDGLDIVLFLSWVFLAGFYFVCVVFFSQLKAGFGSHFLNDLGVHISVKGGHKVLEFVLILFQTTRCLCLVVVQFGSLLLEAG